LLSINNQNYNTLQSVLLGCVAALLKYNSLGDCQCVGSFILNYLKIQLKLFLCVAKITASLVSFNLNCDLKMAFAEGVNSSKQYADAIYHKFSELVQKRPPENVNKRLYDINVYLEKIIQVMYANHYNSIALFAIVTYCCVHVNFKAVAL
jgi:hypothetical protein